MKNRPMYYDSFFAARCSNAQNREQKQIEAHSRYADLIALNKRITEKYKPGTKYHNG